MTILLGIGLIILAIFAIVGNISNSKQFGRKILSDKLYFYILVLVGGIVLIIF
ncbi:hypothetical protein COSHB9_25060 [Companilactobacillus alimentarius]|uniref:hypothetical protein n=1 Tax=Companilactobacillus alimentarius TaxID=1602 RepID=UPI0006F02B39|nr:hypothetical protein [Companilactobacillus alimentarius]KRK75310.1 hypothetical protein FC67_GL001826 [Companilactobacillus alimentarius DSM 20249]MDT6951549.1 hypothetical protein [Companilactobacillus alimentarius]GEO43907.1 hypothetical protein LAL01_01390 [Companilactobacillus alimentarius]